MCNIYTDNGEWSQRHPYSKVHGANIGPTWVLSAPDGPHEPYYQGNTVITGHNDNLWCP